MNEHDVAVTVTPSLPPTLPPGDGVPEVLIVDDVTGDRDPDDPNPPPIWAAVEVSLLTYRSTLQKVLKPHLLVAVPDPLADDGSTIAVNVRLDAPTSEWPYLLATRIPALRAKMERLAEYDRLIELLEQRGELDDELSDLLARVTN